jgi:hypothetical protein
MASVGRPTYHLPLLLLRPSAEPSVPLFVAGAEKSNRPVSQRLTLDELLIVQAGRHSAWPNATV